MASNAQSCEPYISKEATQQDKFLAKYPEYDGRGIKIAILDASVTDVSLPGMQETTLGLPKVVDCFDFSCNRVVDTSRVEEVDNDNMIEGLSGLSLKLPSKWKNPSGKWHLGLFWFHYLYFKETYKREKDNKDTSEDQIDENEKARIFKEETKSLALYHDCIVWHDGDKWRACIDTSYSDDLENAKVLTNFEDEHEFGFLWDKISYCIKIHNDGDQLEIISSYYYPRKELSYGTREHGTIVSHVAAAHFPCELGKDGVAPGAQIISMYYGSSSEKLKTALLKCIELGVDIINFSVKLNPTYEINKIIKEMTEKHGICFILGARNDGPLYTSVQDDYCTFHDDMYVIGSVLTAEMTKKLYDYVDVNVDGPPVVFYYSSKGILSTGEKGLDFTAPGAVVTSIPQWSSDEAQFYKGTSVAAPNTAGSIACLLSALKANSIPYSPELLKFVLSNTAYVPSNGSKLDFGNGIIQMDAAFEYFKKHGQALPRIVSSIPEFIIHEKKKKSWFKLENKGILFVKKECDVIKNYSVTLNVPANNNTDEIQWQLKTQGPENFSTFIEHSGTIKDQTFNITVDTRNLQKGTINYAEIQGYDLSNLSLGPLFHLPVTVITPINMTKNRPKLKKVLTLPLLIPYNLFITAPPACNRCIMKFTHLHENKQNCIFLQVADIDRCYVSDHQRLNFTLTKNVQYFAFPVNVKQQQKVFEISFYRRWFKELKMFNLEITFDKTYETKTVTIKKKRRNR